ncbi:MAG: inositol monophosphatase [Gemmatimonadetes bacterium]|nr:inositol monophosphatase [Gemmatimonadota bacterium]
MTEFVRTALAAAEAAAEVHRRRVGRVPTEAWEEKGRRNFVTEVDREAEQAALEVIRQRHPGHRILAEEGSGDADVARASGRLWIVDPLDGTTNFLHGHPQFSASVAVSLDGLPAAGAVVCPVTGERWWAARGLGAFKNGRRIRVSGIRNLGQALIGTGFPFKTLHLLPEYLTQFDRVLPQVSGIRRGGSAALDLCYLATGYLDAFWELWLDPWDIAAGTIIVREAGGVVSRLDGGELDLEGGAILAGNIYLYDRLGDLVRGEAGTR